MISLRNILRNFHAGKNLRISLGDLGRLKKGKLFIDEYYTYACLQDPKSHLFQIEIIDKGMLPTY